MGLKEHIWPSKRMTMAATFLLGAATFCGGSYLLIKQMGLPCGRLSIMERYWKFAMNKYPEGEGQYV